MAEGCEASHEPLDILDIPDLVYFNDGRDHVRVHLNAALGDDVSQELALRVPKGALFQVQIDAEAPEVSAGFF
jgi:hypothetical protein